MNDCSAWCHAAVAERVSSGESASAHAASLVLIDSIVQAQTSVMACNNAFILLSITFLFALPAVLLLRRPKRAAPPPADAH